MRHVIASTSLTNVMSFVLYLCLRNALNNKETNVHTNILLTKTPAFIASIVLTTVMAVMAVPQKSLALKALPKLTTVMSWLSLVCLMGWIGSAKGSKVDLSAGNTSKPELKGSKVIKQEDENAQPGGPSHNVWGYLTLLCFLITLGSYAGNWYMKRAYRNEYNAWVGKLPPEISTIIHQIDATDARPS